MWRTGWTLGAVALVAAGLLTACGDACDDLNDRCEACEDPQQKIRCAIIVGEDDADACQLLLDDAAFNDGCP